MKFQKFINLSSNLIINFCLQTIKTYNCRNLITAAKGKKNNILKYVKNL